MKGWYVAVNVHLPSLFSHISLKMKDRMYHMNCFNKAASPSIPPFKTSVFIDLELRLLSLKRKALRWEVVVGHSD